VTQQSAQQLMLALSGRLSRAEQAGEASAALLRKVRPPSSSQFSCIEFVQIHIPMLTSLPLSCSFVEGRTKLARV